MAVVLILMQAFPARALTKFWDANGGLFNGVGGSATWGNTFSFLSFGDLFLSGATSSDDLIFQGTAGTITLDGNRTADSLTFNTTGYKITGNDTTTRVLTGPISLDSNVNLIIGNGETDSRAITLASSVTGDSNSSITLNATATGSNITQLNFGSTTTVSVPITVTGTGFGGIASTSGAPVISGQVTGNGQRLNLGAAGTSITFSNRINNGTGTVRIAAGTAGGSGIVTISSNNNTWGNTELNNASNGVLRLGVANALPTTTKLIFGATAGYGNSTLDMSGRNQTIAQLTSGAQAGGIITNSVSGTTSTLTINGSDATSPAFSGSIQNGAGTLALVRSGTGTTILSGASTYTGGTTISGGTLQVNNTTGSATGTGRVTVEDDGKLQGTGTITGEVTVERDGVIEGGTGTTAGTLTVGGLEMRNGSQATFQLMGNGVNDRLVITQNGGFEMKNNAVLKVVLNYTVTSASDTFNLLDWVGAIQGDSNIVNNLDLSSNPTPGLGYVWNTSTFNVDGILRIAAVPEPSRVLLLGLGFFVLVLRRRRA